MTAHPRTDPNITPAVSAFGRVPECPRGCGFAGWPTATASPYRGCDGRDQTLHQRAPVAEEFRAAPAPVQPDSPSVPSQPPRRHRAKPRPSTRGRGTPPALATPPPVVRVPKGARGRCGTCNRDVGLQAGPDGPVLYEHRWTGVRCGGSGHPPRITAGAR